MPLYESLVYLLCLIIVLASLYSQRRRILNFFNINSDSFALAFIRDCLGKSSLVVAKSIQVDVNAEYKISVKNEKDSLKFELGCPIKIKEINTRLSVLKEGDEDVNFVNLEIDFYREYYSRRTEISEIARNLIAFISKIKGDVSSAVIKLTHLFEDVNGTVKDSDLDLFKEIGGKPHFANESFKILVDNVEVFLVLNYELLDLKKNLIVKRKNLENAILHGINQAKFIEEKKIAETNVNNTEEKIENIKSSISENFDNLKKMLVIQEFDIFNELAQDIESGVALTSFLTLNNQNCSKICSFYNRYEAVESHINIHLPTIRYIASESASVLEFTHKDPSILWSALAGLSENSTKKCSYKGVFSELNNDELETARELSAISNVQFSIDNNTDCRNIDSLLASLPNKTTFDTLVLNDWFTYCQSKYNLEKLSPFVNKYIILTCTKFHADKDSNFFKKKLNNDLSLYPDEYDKTKKGIYLSIGEFVDQHPEWKISIKYDNNYGMVVLKKAQKSKILDF
jgi:hypothetical protein